MVKNLLIARKTCRPIEGVGMFIILKKNYIFLNDRFRLALVKILTQEKYLKNIIYLYIYVCVCVCVCECFSL